MYNVKKCIKTLAVIIMWSICINALVPITVLANEEQMTSGRMLKTKFEQFFAGEQVSAETLKAQYELELQYNNIRDKMVINDAREGLIRYEEIYAGAYIEDGSLIVCVKEVEDIIDFEKIIDETDRIKYRLVETSYNELVETQDRLEKLYIELYKKYCDDENSIEFELLTSITGFGISEAKNGILVDIIDLDILKEKTFKSLFGEDEIIKLNSVIDSNQDCDTYRPGGKIRVITDRNGTTIYLSNISIGYRAKRENSAGQMEYGFVTCGHGIKDSIDGNVYSGSSLDVIVGTIEDWRYEGSVDASFIKLASGHVMGTTVQYNEEGGVTSVDTISQNEYMAVVAEGSVVYQVGAKSYKSSAEIISTDYSCTVSGVAFSNLIRARGVVYGGDSGGIAYKVFKTRNIPFGIVKGGTSTTIIYTRAANVVSSMGVIPY